VQTLFFKEFANLGRCSARGFLAVGSVMALTLIGFVVFTPVRDIIRLGVSLRASFDLFAPALTI